MCQHREGTLDWYPWVLHFVGFRWESRYVGGLRAINAALLDSYLLKSLDEAPTFDTAADAMVIAQWSGLVLMSVTTWTKKDFAEN